MRLKFLILILLIPCSIFGQEVYFSPKTEYLNTGEIELINRTISINDNFIEIRTQIEKGIDIQVLKIIRKRLNKETNPATIIYDCTSLDEVYPTLLFIPQRKVITEILAIQPSLVDGSEENFRFLIEAQEQLILQ